MKILIMGLSGAGKTTLAKGLFDMMDQCAWFNADQVRNMANDWDFTPQGRTRQAQRMRHYADFETGHGRIALCDFIAPTQAARDEFNADITIWMDTINHCKYEDTNRIFEAPGTVFLRIKNWNYDIDDIIKRIQEATK